MTMADLKLISSIENTTFSFEMWALHLFETQSNSFG